MRNLSSRGPIFPYFTAVLRTPLWLLHRLLLLLNFVLFFRNNPLLL